MKTTILKLSTLVLLFGFITAGCQKDDIFELQIGDENAVIVHEVNGIEFKFCLLNELGCLLRYIVYKSYILGFTLN